MTRGIQRDGMGMISVKIGLGLLWAAHELSHFPRNRNVAESEGRLKISTTHCFTVGHFHCHTSPDRPSGLGAFREAILVRAASILREAIVLPSSLYV
jgi:hypothetical protein